MRLIDYNSEIRYARLPTVTFQSTSANQCSVMRLRIYCSISCSCAVASQPLGEGEKEPRQVECGAGVTV
jgi:hypothetical protein